MPLMLVVTVSLVFTCTGILSQEISLEIPTRKVPCLNGLRSGIDSYLILGIVGPNFTELETLGWKVTVNVQVLITASSKYETICQIKIAPTVCNGRSTIKCYCNQISRVTGAAHIVVASSSQARHSEGILRGEWQHNSGTTVYSNNVTLPRIYDEKDAVLLLVINGKAVVSIGGNCSSGLIVNERNMIQLCCLRTAEPCYPRISINQRVVAENQTQCVRISLLPTTIEFRADLVQSYSVCSMTNYTIRSKCFIKTDTNSTDLLPPTTAFDDVAGWTPPTGPSAKERNKQAIIFAIIIVIIFALCILGVDTYIVLRWRPWG